MIRLAAVWAALRWHWSMIPTRFGYWLRPYCWRIDDRHWVWQHRMEPSCLEVTTALMDMADIVCIDCGRPIPVDSPYRQRPVLVDADGEGWSEILCGRAGCSEEPTG